MHSCGHDAHTAILLSVAEFLKENEDKLGVMVRLIFQPSEEGAESGGKMLTENGAVDGVEEVIASHCDMSLPTGELGVCIGDCMAACVPLTVRCFGKTSHATRPEKGIDAIAMALRFFEKASTAVGEEANGDKYIWSLGRITGGTAHNVISDKCEMEISFRFFNVDFGERVENRVYEILADVEKEFGGKIQLDWKMSTGALINDKDVAEKIIGVANKAGLAIKIIPSRMSSEDFGWYLTKARGALFRFGTFNADNDCVAAAHCNDFKIDEPAMKSAINLFCEYALNG